MNAVNKIITPNPTIPTAARCNARAIINKPQVIIADEPTGNLDKENSDNVFNYLMDYVESEKMTLIMATHNIALSSKSKKQINLF